MSGDSSSSSGISHLWTDEKEANLQKWGEEAKGYSWMHGKCKTWYSFIDKCIGIPGGLLSIIIGVAIANFSCDGQLWYKITFSILSILAGGFAFLQNYLQYSKRATKHGEASTQYLLLADDIESALALDRSSRQSCKRFYKKIQHQRKQLISLRYPSIMGRYVKKYNKIVYNTDIHRPLVTGNITEININRDERPDEAPRPEPSLNRVINDDSRRQALAFELDRYGDEPPV